MEYIKKNREIHGLFYQNFTKIFFPSKFQICLALFFLCYFRIQSNSKDIVLNPHEVLKMTDQATISKILAKKRKQGRPTAFEKFVMPEPKKKRSNQLKEQFGLTIGKKERSPKIVVLVHP